MGNLGRTLCLPQYHHSRQLTQIVSLLLLGSLLSACVTMSSKTTIHPVSSRGGQIKVIEGGAAPVLVVNSQQGIGHAVLSLPAALPQGLLIELPGFHSLEELVLSNGQTELVCQTGREEKGDCRWGEEWPVAEVRRYANGITVTIPAQVFQQGGAWSLRWVNEFR